MGDSQKIQINPLPLSYYQKTAPILAKDLLGKVLFTQFNGELCSGRIVETEAYAGAQDRACHAYKGKKTERTKVMFSPGGVSYVYLCYGIHHLFNIVVHEKENPHAILISGIEPLLGVETMIRRRGLKKMGYNLCNGPGSLAKALGIDRSANGLCLLGPSIWLEDDGYQPDEIVASPRINIDYAKEDAKRPWRFRIKDSKWGRPIKS